MGFGARRLFDDDRMPAKYINTPETLLYKKSHVLYGLDLARMAISKKSQAVVVEGYTDVMAAHLSGVDTAVASCGTAFGDDHARLLRRLMGNHDAFHGEVIFTFDGDAAGQAAALKVFAGDQNFVDPDLRGDRADRAGPLRRPTPARRGGRTGARRAAGAAVSLRDEQSCSNNMILIVPTAGSLRCDAAAPLVASIRDNALVAGYARELAGLLGMDVEEVRAEVMRAAARSGRRPVAGRPPHAGARAGSEHEGGPALPLLPSPGDRLLTTERQTAKLLIQNPNLFPDAWDGLTTADFTHPAYAAVFTAVEKASVEVGGAGVTPGTEWVHRVSEAC